MRSGKIAVDLRHLRAGSAHAIGQRPGAWERAEIAVLEIGLLRLGVLQLLLALFELCIEKAQSLAGLIAIASKVFLDENVDQLLHDLTHDLRAAAGGSDLE